jgi:2-desacetyl-2-hydroxyethyl bacteriochlorophyllide A dehydrogenase
MIMTQQTDAVVFTESCKAALQKIEMPAPGPGEVQVRTVLSTISAGTEGWIYRNLFTWSPTPFPCVPGYQRVGVITARGPGVTGWRMGERVMAIAGEWRGKVSSFWGAHVALANTPVGHLFRLHRSVGDIEGSGAVVAQVGFNAASRADVPRGNWALVCGDGLIGQCAAQAVRAKGLRVILVGHRAERLELAAKFSADVVVNNRKEEVVTAVHRHTNGKPVAVVLDSVQGESVQKEYMPLLERGRGQIVYCGFSPERAWADMAILQQQEITTYFVSGWTRPRMETTLRLMAEGKMRLKPLVTHLVPFGRAPEMYEMVRLKSEPFLGITLNWTNTGKG